MALMSAAPTAGAQQQEEALDGPRLHAQMREAQRHLENLRARLQQTRARLKLPESQARAEIVVVNRMSNDFVVTAVRLWLDDAPAYARSVDGGVSATDLHVTSGPLSPGEHVARVVIELRGDGSALPYMRAYRFELHSSHTFMATAGRMATIGVRTFERGNPTTPYVQLPAIEWTDAALVPAPRTTGLNAEARKNDQQLVRHLSDDAPEEGSREVVAK